MDELFVGDKIVPNDITIYNNAIDLPEEEIVALSDETLEEASKKMKEETLLRTRNELKDAWVTEAYIIENIKNIAEYATTSTKTWDVIDDYPTKLAALKKLDSMREKAYKVNQRDPVEVVFRPVFSKPPKLS